jgi:23S rRNA (pseudouridine1915-N3)-methyltransferase
MQKIKILWPGKTKDRSLAEGINYYLKLLTPMAQLSVVEVREERGKPVDAAQAAESKKILKQTTDYYLLDERGRQYTSVEFARFLQGHDRIEFVMGGAFGVNDEVRQKAKGTIALSMMTLTHEMARLLFLEQLYRAFTILKGKEYHH